MIRIFIISTLTGFALAQTSVPGGEDIRLETDVVGGAAKRAAAASATAAPSDTVLTIHGICSLEGNLLSASAEDCTVVVQRQQFDSLLKVAAPGGQATPAARRSLAKTYATLLAFEIAAQRAGIESSAQFRESMEWSRLRMLADLYRRNLEKETSAVSEHEIDDYYNQHVSEFEEVKIRRMLVPKNAFAGADRQESEKRALEVATDLRERAANGEDPDQLQKETYIAAGFNSIPPTTEVGTRRRSSLPSEVRDDVFALGPGELTKVEREAYSFVIYKVDAKNTLPKEKVRGEIAREIAKQKLDAALQSVTGSVRADLNDDYFGPALEQ